MLSWSARIKKTIGILTTTLFALSIVGEVATAYPQYTQKTGKSCAYCHTNPSGGKELTAAGKYYSKNKTLPPAAKSSSTGSAGKSSATTQKSKTATTAKAKSTTKSTMKPKAAPAQGGKGRSTKSSTKSSTMSKRAGRGQMSTPISK